MLPLLVTLMLSNQPVAIPGALQAEAVRPDEPADVPGILLVEGWFQEGQWERFLAEELASAGHVVLRVLPDRPRPPQGDRDALHALMAGPPDTKTRASLHDAIEWLRGKDGRHPVVVMGARMGGRDALALSGEPGVIGVVSWYGTPPATLPERHAPILAMFGGKDFGPTVEDARRLEAASRGGRVTVEIFPDAQHGFADPNNTWGGYDKKAAEASYFLAFKFLIDVRPRP